MTELNEPMMVIRKRLSATEGAPPDTRINPETGEVETSIDGGATWQENPGADPRKNPAYLMPPGEDACAAAAGMVYGMKQFIAAAVTVTTAAGVATILLGAATIILGPIGWMYIAFLLASGSLIAGGGMSVYSSFTPEVWEFIQCAFYCNLNENNQLDEAGLERVRWMIADEYPGNVTTGMQLFFSAWGHVGISNAGVVYADPEADCEGCPSCTWAYNYHPADEGWYWSQAYAFNCSNAAIVGGVPYGTLGTRDSHEVWLPTPIPPANTTKGLHFTMLIPIPPGCTVTHALFYVGAVGNHDSVYKRVMLGNLVVCHQAFWVNPRGWTTLTLTDQTMQIEVQMVDGNLLKDFWFDYIHFEGTGDMPPLFNRPEGMV